MVVQRQLLEANSDAQELKEKFFIFLCVEVQRHFQQLRDSDPGDSVVAIAPSEQRVEELAQEMTTELDSHLQICQELAKTKEDAEEVHQFQALCEEELAELAKLQEEDDGDDGYEVKRRLAVGAFQEEEAALEELLTLAEAEEMEVSRLRALVDFEEQLGLPRIEIHDEVVILGRSEDPSCSVEVKWDDAGHLLLAQPHPSLHLDHEAAKAVEQDDLGRLLVLVWDRASNREGSKPAE